MNIPQGVLIRAGELLTGGVYGPTELDRSLYGISSYSIPCLLEYLK